MDRIRIGTSSDGVLEFSLDTLQRHIACFGSSGSGKTIAGKVLMEEIARTGVPVIAFDPQGDIASLAITADRKLVKAKGTDPAIRDHYDENVEVLIWTPGSSKGLPLSINPLQFDGVETLNAEDKTRFFSSTAKNIVSLVGYDLDSVDGKSAETILAVIFEHCFDQRNQLRDFGDVVKILQDMPESVVEVVSAVSSPKILRDLTKKLSLLTLGARKLLFQTGVPANIDTLLGKDGSTDKTRISVIYLNTLQTTEEKEFFISGIAQLLYRWMLKHPLGNGQSGIQCAMFIDEIAPYIPPVKVPACKENLELLFRQGRKYGVSCLIATQSPGDIDYKSVGQFATFILGRLNTKQDIDKVKKRLESVAPQELDFISNKLPALKPGNFLAVSPDEFDSVREMRVRWLVTDHRVISEEHLGEYISDEIRDKYIQTENEEPSARLDPDAVQEDELGLSVTSNGPEPKVDRSMNEVFHVRNGVFERDLIKNIKPHLAGGLFKSEEMIDTNFVYLPLIRVALVMHQEKGLFKKTVLDILENLYLDYRTHHILHITKTQFLFSSVVDLDPNKISDLDDFCEIESVDKKSLDYDFRGLGRKKIDVKSIRNAMERKYRVEVNDADLLLFPTWECTLRHKKSGDKRKIILDGVTGLEVTK